MRQRVSIAAREPDRSKKQECRLSPKSQSFIDRLKDEIAYYEENKDCFGYVFYIERKK